MFERHRIRITRGLAGAGIAAAVVATGFSLAGPAAAQVAAPAPLTSQRATQPAAPPTSYPTQLVREAKSKPLCESDPGRVFVQFATGSACIAYHAPTGLPATLPVVVFFDGDVPLDQVSSSVAGFAGLKPQVERLSRQMGVRLVVVSRPGIGGSSGNHGERRRVGEYQAMHATVDAIKTRLGVNEVTLAGQSGGSAVVASLLTFGRRDITCAVMGSGVLFTSEWLLAHLRRRGDTRTRAEDLRRFVYDPSDHVGAIQRVERRRLIVVGDPADSNTPFALQRRFSERLKSLGHHALTIEVRGMGSMMHGVVHATLPAAALCARGLADERIVQTIRPVGQTPVAAAPPAATPPTAEQPRRRLLLQGVEQPGV